MDRLTRAWLKVIIDGQAYLYANDQRTGLAYDDEQFEKWQNEWKEASAVLVQELLDDDGDSDDVDNDIS